MASQEATSRVAKILAKATSPELGEAHAALEGAYKRMVRDKVTINDLLSLPVVELYQESLVKLVSVVLENKHGLSPAEKRKEYADFMSMIVSRFLDGSEKKTSQDSSTGSPPYGKAEESERGDAGSRGHGRDGPPKEDADEEERKNEAAKRNAEALRQSAKARRAEEERRKMEKATRRKEEEVRKSSNDQWEEVKSRQSTASEQATKPTTGTNSSERKHSPQSPISRSQSRFEAKTIIFVIVFLGIFIILYNKNTSTPPVVAEKISPPALNSLPMDPPVIQGAPVSLDQEKRVVLRDFDAEGLMMEKDEILSLMSQSGSRFKFVVQRSGQNHEGHASAEALQEYTK